MITLNIKLKKLTLQAIKYKIEDRIKLLRMYAYESHFKTGCKGTR